MVSANAGDLERLRRIRPNLELRASVISALRQFLESRGSLEVETPQMVRTPGTDLHLDPQPAGDGYLITSPEFHMKRLVGAGYQRVHQLCHCFRRGEAGALHNPEFTMLEWYWAGTTYMELALELEELIAHTASCVTGSALLAGREVDLSVPHHRITVKEAFEQHAGWTPGPAPDPDRFFLDLVDKVEPRLGKGRPSVLYEYPASQAILSRLHPENDGLALRFELYIDGIEIVNAFDELTDADEQRRRFEDDNRERKRRGLSTLPIDESLLQAIDTMPQTSGAALGVDRLVMLLAGKRSIEEVMAFPASWLGTVRS